MRAMYSAVIPNGTTPWPRLAAQIASHTVSASPAGHPDLVAEVAGVAGPRDVDRDLADLRRGHAEVRQLGDDRGRGRASSSRERGPWTASTAQSSRDVLDPDVEPADELLEVGQVRLGRGEHELVGPVAQDHPVLDDEAAVVAPDRVLGVTRRRSVRMSRARTPARKRSASGTVDPVLVQRRGVEQAGRVADREVLELLRHLVAGGGQVARPVLPQARLVERAQCARGRASSGSSSGLSVRPGRRTGRGGSDPRRRGGPTVGGRPPVAAACLGWWDSWRRPAAGARTRRPRRARPPRAPPRSCASRDRPSRPTRSG